ncbi:STY0301 family protein [Kosakonia sp.]|uniref:STY0301 family protein n=1 Tax=Kosakonia sp. TaxID=1916651 RepID=UPI00289E0CE1|nr:STY0301 family protein [Kosakonia sp.]
MTMWWNKNCLLAAAVWLTTSMAQAATTQCPQYPNPNDKSHSLEDASLFIGPQKDKVDLMPDTDQETVWTLPDYQDAARKDQTSLHFICRYKNTKQTVDLTVSATAQTCSVAYDKKDNLIAACK